MMVEGIGRGPFGSFERSVMSKEGIKKAAAVFDFMQKTHSELLGMIGQTIIGTPSSKQDILLAQMLDKAKDHIKDEFSQITMMRTEEDS